MSAPLAALLGRGAGGVPAPAPVEFATLIPPRSPNWCLAAPAGRHPAAQHVTPPLPCTPEAAWPVLRAVAARLPRTFPLAEWAERHQAHWVVRSRWANFPDLVVAELTKLPEGGTGLFLYSRSLFGYHDFGVNRRRVVAWLAALDAALPRR